MGRGRPRKVPDVCFCLPSLPCSHCGYCIAYAGLRHFHSTVLMQDWVLIQYRMHIVRLPKHP